MADGQPTILVVDDEILIRAGVEDHLSNCGFTTLAAGNASEAVMLLLAHPEIDLVFTDVNMPGGMDGMELARWVRRYHPTLPVIVTTAEHGRKLAMEQLRRQGGTSLLFKPYHMQTLSGQIADALAESGGRMDA